jgi:DNA-binding transcriptional MerR regulator
MSYLRTTDLARAVGVHPNTVRRYVDRGLLPPVARSPSGYRRFTPRHLDCLRLACQVYCIPHPGRALRESGARIVRAAVPGDLARALELAHQHLALVRSEPNAPSQPLRIGQVARLLGVTLDIVRSWDRNGLIDIPRDPANGYRRYGAAEISRLRVIRMLSRAGYSLSAILRMLIQLDRGETTDLRHALDTPRPAEDARLAADHWLSTLTDQERRAHTLIALLEAIMQQQTTGNG